MTTKEVADKLVKLCSVGQFAEATDARLESIDSCHKPSRVKMCEGMCSACGESGAIFA